MRKSMVSKGKNNYLSLVAGAGAVVLALLVALFAQIVTVQAATVTSYQYGDADNDLDVDASDYTVLKNIILAKTVWNPYGDADIDGDIDASDYTVLKNIILAKIPPKQGSEPPYDFGTNTSGPATQ